VLNTDKTNLIKQMNDTAMKKPVD